MVKLFLILMMFIFLNGCSTIGLNSCTETCSLNGVKKYNHEAGICECWSGIKYTNSFNGTQNTIQDKVLEQECEKDIDNK
jgi:hypothetical protein